MAHSATILGTVRILNNTHHEVHASALVRPFLGPRLEECRSATAATARYGDELLRRTNYAEQSEISFPRAASRNTRGKLHVGAV